MTQTIERRAYVVDVPERMRELPTDPRTRHLVPFFVHRDDDGSFDFRVIGRGKIDYCTSHNACWLCGQWMGGGDKWFAIGPMCAINRISSEPPSHHECVRFAVQTCPFMLMPKASRRETGVAHLGPAGGVMVTRNPGVTLLWHTRRFRRITGPKHGTVFDVGEPFDVEWWAQGRRATRDEVLASIDSGLPTLYAADGHNARARREIDERKASVVATLLPAE